LAFSALVKTSGFSGLGLKAQLELGDTAVTGLQLPGVTSQSITLDVPVIATVAWTGVAIANIGGTPDEVQLSAYDGNGLLLATSKLSVPLHGGVVQLVSELFSDIKSIAYLRVDGANRLLGMTLSQTYGGSFLSYPADAGPPKVLAPDPSRTYFLVGNPSFGELTSETYVIGLSNPAHIAEARGILADPSIRKTIVNGSIARGHGGHNRNMTERGGPAYSWHMEEFKGFAEIAVEVCDGKPSDVEFEVNYWINNVGQICIWSFTIVRELTFEEVRTGVLGARAIRE
jgi:hypothetical protein